MAAHTPARKEKLHRRGLLLEWFTVTRTGLAVGRSSPAHGTKSKGHSRKPSTLLR